MARRWMGVALLAGWLGVSASARAQYPAAPDGATDAGEPPPPVAGALFPSYPPAPGPAYGPGPGGGPPPGYPGPEFGPPAPPVDGPMPPAESLPPNSFSNVRPDLVVRSPRFYLEADYLLWWIRKRQLPPLVSAGVNTDAIPAAIGQPGTVAVIGPSSADTAQNTGGRLSAYYWFDQDHTCGVDATGFILEEREATRVVGGSGDTPLVLGRPFTNAITGAQDADPLVLPGVQGGHLAVALPRRFMGADANLRFSQCDNFLAFNRLTMLAGVRYVYLDEKVLISEGVVGLPDVFGNPGPIVALHDNFVTYNRFYGGQAGLEAEARVGPLLLLLTGKIAAGINQQVIKNSGDTTLNEPGFGVVVDPRRGLLVQPTNGGRFTHNPFAVVPEVTVTLAWEFNEHLRASLGYNFLYWTEVVRPGDQIDTTVNVGAVGAPTQFAGPTRPGVPFRTTGFWAQGFSAGLLVSY